MENLEKNPHTCKSRTKRKKIVKKAPLLNKIKVVFLTVPNYKTSENEYLNLPCEGKKETRLI